MAYHRRILEDDLTDFDIQRYARDLEGWSLFGKVLGYQSADNNMLRVNQVDRLMIYTMNNWQHSVGVT